MASLQKQLLVLERVCRDLNSLNTCRKTLKSKNTCRKRTVLHMDVNYRRCHEIPINPSEFFFSTSLNNGRDLTSKVDHVSPLLSEVVNDS